MHADCVEKKDVENATTSIRMLKYIRNTAVEMKMIIHIWVMEMEAK